MPKGGITVFHKDTWKWSYILLSILGLVILIITQQTITKEWEKEIADLQENNEDLRLQLDDLQDQLEIYMEIIQRDKKHIRELEEEIERLRTIRARVTAYSPLDNQSGICADSDPTVTATGTRPRIGVVAVDPNKIPYGTEMFVPNYGVAVAEDTGGLIRSYDGIAIDLTMETYAEAMAWGVQYLDVKVFW